MPITSNRNAKSKSPVSKSKPKSSGYQSTAPKYVQGKPTTSHNSKKVTLSEHVQIKGLKQPTKISLPEGGPTERTAYVEYALDMLTHNLIGTGQLDPSKAHLVKTPEMRDHVNKLTDRVQAAQKVGLTTQISTKVLHPNHQKPATKWAIQPNSLPITIITDKDPTKQKVRPKNTFNPLQPDRKRMNVLKIPLSPTSKVLLPVKQHQGLEKQGKDNKRNTSSPRNETTIRSVSFHEAASNDPNTEQKKESLKAQQDSQHLRPTMSLAMGKFKAKFDMRGFTNDEISLDLKGRELRVTGIRLPNDGLPARKTVENIEIPPGVDLDGLKVARRADGILIIQEGSKN